MPALYEAAQVFLAGEEEFCQHSCPEYLEASLGMTPEDEDKASPLDDPEPISVPLPNGGSFRARGRIDRVDRMGDESSHDFAIWDYKTGSTYKFRESQRDPFIQGRLLQYALYVPMVESVLNRKDRKATVRQAGYYFPTGRGQGERIFKTREELARARAVMQSLCQIVANGAFLATDDRPYANDSKHDCDYCDYKLICHDLEATTAASRIKLANGRNHVLKPMRELRGNG